MPSIEAIYNVIVVQFPGFDHPTFKVNLILMITMKLGVVDDSAVVFAIQLLLVLPAHDVPRVIIEKVAAILKFLLNGHNLVIASISFPEGRIADGHRFGENLFALRF